MQYSLTDERHAHAIHAVHLTGLEDIPWVLLAWQWLGGTGTIQYWFRGHTS